MPGSSKRRHTFPLPEAIPGPAGAGVGIAGVGSLAPAWGPTVKEVNWLSPRPFGVGTTREVVLAPRRGAGAGTLLPVG